MTFRHGILGGRRRGSGGGGTAPSGYEPETIMFMDATSTPDDATASIYPNKTNNDCWVLLDNVIKFWKSEGVWNGIYHWHPMFGGNTLKHGYNAKDVGSFYMNFSGGWVFDNKGNKGNGSNTRALFGFVPATHMNFENSGLTIVVTNEVSESKMEMGSTSDTNRRTYIQARSNNRFYVRIGNTAAFDIAVPSSTGIKTGIRKNGLVSGYDNGVLIGSGNAGGLGLSQVQTCYGDYNNAGNIGGFCTAKTLSSAMHHTADNPLIIEQGLRMWETGLGRLI